MPETASILLLHGNDEFAIARHIDQVCASLGDPASAEMNITRFDGRLGVDMEALHAAVNAAPFLSDRRVMVLAHPLVAFNTPERREKLLDLLEKAQPSTSILLVEDEALKQEHWLVKWMNGASSRARVHVYSLPKKWEMPRWIESETKRLGGKIEPGAAARLSELVGEDTRIASQEIRKLLTYINYERPVSTLDVERAGAASPQGNIFELVDALGLGDGSKAQHVLHSLLEEVEAGELWGMVIRQFRLLLLAREMLDARASLPDIQKGLDVHEFVAKKVSNQAGRFSLPVLEDIYHRLLEIDEQAKTSQMPLDLALDMLIVVLAGGGNATGT